MKRNDIRGQRFGRLQVLAFEGTAKNGNARWRCRCDCGQEVVVDGYRLRSGKTVSCGCYRRELMRQRIRENRATAANIGNPASLNIIDHVNVTALSQLSTKNRSGHVGVSYEQATDKWVARMTFRGRLVLNTHFATCQAAIAARVAAEQKYLAPLLAAHPDHQIQSVKKA